MSSNHMCKLSDARMNCHVTTSHLVRECSIACLCHEPTEPQALINMLTMICAAF